MQNSRRLCCSSEENRVCSSSPPLRLRCAQHRAQNSGVSSAPAEIAAQPLFDLVNGWPARTIQNRFRTDDHSIRTVTALSRLFRDKRCLHFVRLFRRTKSFEGCYSTSGGLGNGHGT